MQDPAPKKRKPRLTATDRAIAIDSLPTGDRPKLVLSLSRHLSDRSPKVTWLALEKVRSENLRELEFKVRGLLSDRSRLVRDSAVECLGTLYEDEGIEASWLYPLLEDSYFLVRIETLESLAQIGDKSALPLIAKKLEDVDPLVRSYAATAIEDLDGDEYVHAIRSALSIEKEERAKIGYASALYYFGDANQFQVLLGFLTSSNYLVRCAAANTISIFKLESDELNAAIKAVNHARKNFLYRGDQSTMETVLKGFRHERSALGNNN
jgi:HEAT repeat protein